MSNVIIGINEQERNVHVNVKLPLDFKEERGYMIRLVTKYCHRPTICVCVWGVLCCENYNKIKY